MRFLCNTYTPNVTPSSSSLPHAHTHTQHEIRAPSCRRHKYRRLGLRKCMCSQISHTSLLGNAQLCTDARLVCFLCAARPNVGPQFACLLSIRKMCDAHIGRAVSDCDTTRTCAKKKKIPQQTLTSLNNTPKICAIHQSPSSQPHPHPQWPVALGPNWPNEQPSRRRSTLCHRPWPPTTISRTISIRTRCARMRPYRDRKSCR